MVRRRGTVIPNRLQTSRSRIWPTGNRSSALPSDIYEIRGREGHSGWEVEVRFDNGTSPKHPERKTPSREEAVRVGREIATMRDSRWSRAARSRHRGRRGLFFSVGLDGVRYAAG